MQRDLHRLAEGVFDICVVGGGIHGAFVALDAAQRGLSVVLIEKGDFGHATSSNSQKVIHGGLRYLQNGDFTRMRESVRERMVWTQIAPHLVNRLPFLIPLHRNADKPKWLIALAMKAYDLISRADRNRPADPEKRIPGGRVISRQECMDLFPETEARDLTGAILFYDGQLHNSERAVLSVVKSADKAGAVVANYVEAADFITEGRHITGVRAKDILTGDEMDIRAKVVVNTVGPWVNDVLGRLDHLGTNEVGHVPELPLCKAINLIVKGPAAEYSVGLRSNEGRLLFATPWRGHTLIGTAQLPYKGDVDQFRVSDEDIQAFVDEINGCRPNLSIRREDVVFHHGGLVPADQKSLSKGETVLAARGRIVDHAKDGGVDGLISVTGVKFTTARSVAEKAVDYATKKLGPEGKGSISATTHLYGGEIERIGDFLADAIAQRGPGLEESTVRNLILNHGTAYADVLDCAATMPCGLDKVTEGSEVIRAEVIHGIRQEMAQTLSDVIFRRTELGSRGDPGDDALQVAADIMAQEAGWTASRTEREIEGVREIFSRGAVYA